MLYIDDNDHDIRQMYTMLFVIQNTLLYGCMCIQADTVIGLGSSVLIRLWVHSFSIDVICRQVFLKNICFQNIDVYETYVFKKHMFQFDGNLFSWKKTYKIRKHMFS